MNKKLRKAIIAGNWKMNKTPSEAKALIEALKPHTEGMDCEIIICVPYVDLQTAIECTKGANISVAAQNCHFEDSGAYTGEISALMLKEMGVEYVIIGHSERRQYFAETDETVNKKLKAALKHGIKPILCVGELLEQRENGTTFEVCEAQIKLAYKDIDKADAKNIVTAYEPVWAIGTGKTATSDEAEQVIKYIRTVIAGIYDKELADGVTIQYGGSMNAKNAEELLDMENIDGGLIGGASLKAEDFAVIIKAAARG